MRLRTLAIGETLLIGDVCVTVLAVEEGHVVIEISDEDSFSIQCLRLSEVPEEVGR